jgi:hypothetical protein
VRWKGKVRAKGTAIENLMCGGALYSVGAVDPDIKQAGTEKTADAFRQMHSGRLPEWSVM